MKKKIKGSQRGLTFTFPETEKLGVGSYVKYYVDLKKRKIVIVPANGENEKAVKVSRKKCGKNFIPLLDLRNSMVKKVIADADYLEVEIQDDRIFVSVYVAERSVIQQCRGQNKKIIYLHDILSARKTGVFQLKQAVGSGMDIGTQISVLSCPSSIDGIETGTTECNEGITDIFKVISLFSGAGMLDIPFAIDPSFEIIYAVDNNPAAVETYRYNVGNHIKRADLSKISAEEMPLADLVIGGPSCNPFASTNRRKRLEEHEDSKLVLEYIKLLKGSGAKVFVLENVPQILTAQEGEYLQQILDHLPEYQITANLLMDKEVGGYTVRKRAILLGSKTGKIYLPDLVVKHTNTVRNAVGMVTDSWRNFKQVTQPGMRTKERMSYVPQGGNFLDIPEIKRSNSTHSNAYRRLHNDDSSPTLVNFRKPPLIHPDQDRILSVAEAAALSGLGQEFEFKGGLSDMQQQCGNGVTYHIAKFIKNVIKKYLLNMIGRENLIYPDVT